jgi:hypothetical protein
MFLKKDLIILNFENKLLKIDSFIDSIVSHMKND